MTATQDDDALDDAAVQLAHEVRGGGYGGVAGAPVAVTIVEDDVSTLALAPAHASEAAGTMRFADGRDLLPLRGERILAVPISRLWTC